MHISMASVAAIEGNGIGVCTCMCAYVQHKDI